MSRTRSFLALFLAAGTALGGCDATRKADHDIILNSTRADELRRQSERPMPAADSSPVRVKDAAFVGAKVSALDYGDPLPTRLETPSGITLKRAAPMRLTQIAAALTEATRIPFVVAPEEVTGSSAAAAGAVHQAVAQGASGGPGGGPVPGMTIGAAYNSSDLAPALAALAGPGSPGAPLGAAGPLIRFSEANPSEMKVDYTGRLSEFLDIVGTHFNQSWQHKNGRIIFSKLITRTFELPALPGAQELEFNLSSGNGQTSGGGAGGQQTKGVLDQKASINSAVDLWKEIKETLGSIVGPYGRFEISPATGTITVTASPNVVQRVQDYADVMKKRMSGQIALSIQVLNVALEDIDSFDNNVAALFTGSTKGAFALGRRSPGFNASDPRSSAIGNLNGATPSLGYAILDPTSPFANSQGAISALSERGNVSVVTSASLTTVNGSPVPLQVVNKRNFVKNVTNTQGTGLSSGVASTTIQTDTVSTGFNLQMVPRILHDGSLLLQYGMNISELVGRDDGFDTFTVNGSTVQLPNVNQRNFVQQSIVPNRSTLVLAGFETARSTSAQSGVGDPRNWLLSGGRSARNRREVVVILITPTLLDVGKATSQANALR
ncbi:Outer membrane lipoprotein BfpB [Methylobacterium hispanicum]|uniref:Outer membrane lipoprotein BfpB n=1 Tax=Methylobacterium hispanicum TaxID=270350 RepID=A0AAV4ZND0_9HYPH|nr:secretin N-terminal domain-containing protein [Methylobacterium hispanicum]GJD89429.1 Outer membrane lipoprotein BfpB [Methylobacterium hispanicum]